MRSFAILLGFVLSISAMAAESAVDYVRDLKPLLSERCYACHGSLKRKSGLRLDAGQFIHKGGKAGPAVVLGKPDDSPLIQAVTGANDMERMPPEGSPLTAEQIAMLRKWIESGAKYPSDEQIPPDPSEHWAFKVPQRPGVPAVKNTAWVRTPVDAFISREHEKLGLIPKAEADKGTLLRRVYLDLIGLPPTREQLQAFLADTSPDAYEKVVDQLLASPRYGERWGRHWMDIWRYSDWAGFGMEVRESQPHIWRWRDWIIESLNEDKPYDRMLQEMLAADEIAPEDQKMMRANGYLARHYNRFNRNGWMDNVVEHTGKAFLGMTFNCARCHDHKFDPVAQKEYYQLRAFFESYNVRIDRVPGQRDTTKDGFTRVFDADEKKQTFLFLRGNDATPDKEPLAPGVPKILGGSVEIKPVALPPAVCYPDLRSFVIAEDRAALKTDCDRALSEVTKAEAAFASAKAAYEKNSKETPESKAEAAAANIRGTPFLHDDFSAANDKWQRGAGQWEYKDGKLIQSRLGMASHEITSNADHPQDFSLRMKFKITGGTTYYSIGFNFDSTAESANTVYLSAHPPGPKAQVSWRIGNNHSYPQAGAVAQPIRTGQEYNLRVDARDKLLNVYVDEKLVLVYTLPHARKTGRLVLWTFDSTGEFYDMQCDALAAEAKLAETVALQAVKVNANPAEALRMAEENVPVAKIKLKLAEAECAFFDARVAFEQNKLTALAAEETKQFDKKAQEAQKAVAIVKAELELQQAEKALADAKAKPEAAKKIEEAEKKTATQKKAVAEARAAPEKPSTPLGAGPVPTNSTGRRLALAQWIAAKSNPLTARVAINHIWLRHFGEALVPTVFDFGLHGKKPSHPELLDWLSCELMDRGWSMKAIHRLLVTSATYRMQSTTREDSDADRKADADNVYLWRANTRRMEGEIVRDSVLHISGKLDLTMGGVEIDHMAALSSNRRSIYFRHASEKQALFLELFDAASTTECYRRNESVVPQQALALANSPLTLAQSRLLAAELGKIAGKDDSKFTTLAFEQVLSRAPSPEESAACAEFLRTQTAVFGDAAAQKKFESGDAASVKPSADAAQRARENLVHVLFNHNDFVTIR
jgi:hypothetical protein